MTVAPRERTVLFKEAKDCAPTVWVRLGQVLEAAGRPAGHDDDTASVGRPGWTGSSAT